MMTRYSAWLDGLPLHEIDPTIYILDIQEDPAQMDVSTAAKAGGFGRFVVARQRQTLSVTISFAIREYDVTRRKAIMQKVIAWAKGGKYLAINDRPGQRLHVEVDELPTIQSSLRWTQLLCITFMAYAFPFGVNEYPDTLTTSGVASMMVMGDADSAPVDVSITPSGSTVTVRADQTTITLTDLSGAVEITHGDDGLLRIVSGGESILSNRTPESSDDLTATPGRVNDFSIEGGTATFRVRGVWA
jgi:hypothetical protein